MPYERHPLTPAARARLLALADDGATPAAAADDEATAELEKAGYLDRAGPGVLVRDEGYRWLVAYLEAGRWRHGDHAAERPAWEALLAALRAHREVWTRPTSLVYPRGGEFGAHALPSRAQDRDVRARVDRLYEGALAETRPEWIAPRPAGDREVLEQLLDHAPDAAETGVDDWSRDLRSDEVALVYGGIPVDRRSWLERADEVAAAWGRPLFGPDGWFGQNIEFFL